MKYFTIVSVAVVILVSAFLLFRPTKTELAATCDNGTAEVRSYIDYERYNPLNIDAPDGSRTQLLYKKNGKEFVLANFLFDSGSNYAPLPFNTKIPITLIKPATDSKDSPAPVDIFLSQSEYSLQEFDEISQCVKSHSTEINDALEKASQRIGRRNETIAIEGVAYVSRYGLSDAIRAATQDGKFSYSFRGSTDDAPDCVTIQDNGVIWDCNNSSGATIFQPDSYAYMMTGDGTESGGSHYDYSFNSKGQSVPQYLRELAKDLENYSGGPAIR